MAGLARYLSLRSGFYDFFQVGAGLHIVAAVTESCVTGFNDSDNGESGWWKVSMGRDVKMCFSSQFGGNREEAMTTMVRRRRRSRPSRQTGGRATSTSTRQFFGRLWRGLDTAPKVGSQIVFHLHIFPVKFSHICPVWHIYSSL